MAVIACDTDDSGHRVRILWAFDITPAHDEGGNDVLPDPDAFTSGLARKPLPFKCVLRPRDEDVRQMVHMEASQSEIALKEWE